MASEQKSERVDFTVSMEPDRIAQLEEMAKTRGLNRVALIRVVVYGWMDEQAKLMGGVPTNAGGGSWSGPGVVK